MAFVADRVRHALTQSYATGLYDVHSRYVCSLAKKTKGHWSIGVLSSVVKGHWSIGVLSSVQSIFTKFSASVS